MMNDAEPGEVDLRELACWAGHLVVALSATRGVPADALAAARALRDTLLTRVADLRARKRPVLAAR